MSLAYGGSLLLPLQAFSEPTFGATGPLSIDERFSVLAEQFLPDFVVNDHPTFVAFMKAFLEYTEQQGNSRAEAVRINTYTDFDQTLDSFEKYFRETYLQNFPKEFSSGVNEDLAIKKVKDYYQNKGNSEAVEFLFRLLYDKEANVEYLRDRIFRLSDSDYSNSVSIYTTLSNSRSTLKDFIGARVYQRKNEFDGKSPINASADIDNIIFRFDTATKVDYAEIVLKNRVGEFLPNFKVILENDSTIKETVFDLVSEVKPSLVGGITQDGSGYALNDTVLIKEGKKIVSKLKVDNVSTLGEIRSISKPIGKPVRIFTVDSNLSVEILTAGGTGASLNILGGRGEIVDENVFESNRSLLSSSSVIQNNFNYQQFSYTISAEKSLKQYADIVKKVFHPAGSMMLGRYETTTNLNIAGFTSNLTKDEIDQDTFVVPLIGNYLPYTISTTSDFRGDTLGGSFGDFYPNGWGGITESPLTFTGSDPDVAPNLVFPYTNQIVPIGNGVYAGDENISPEYIQSVLNESEREIGYDVAPKTQIPMTASDAQRFGQGFSGGYIIYRHPRTLFKENRTDDELSKINNKYEFASSRGKVRIRLQSVDMTISGISGSIQVGDELTQTVSGQVTALGEVTAVKSKDFSRTPAAKERKVTASAPQNKFTVNPLLSTTSSVGSGVVGFNNTVLTVKVKSGSFTSQGSVKVFADDGDSFTILGDSASASLPIVSSVQEDMEFGNVRISDFLDKMSVPKLDT
tara:strand:- start:8199 stop:10430 length:2232 start_codon:yes stop_codon:yes gene_type:complete